jgi:hypothetical protein
MKAATMFSAFCFAGVCSNVIAGPPPAALAELKLLKLSKLMVRVDQIPSPLREVLAKTFHQKVLKLGNPQDLIGGAVTYTGDPARFAPYRRLIFAFETQRYAFVYYESGDPELSASCLIFDITNSQHPRFIWGGADLHRPFARNPLELRERIARGKLWDDKPYIW